MAVLSSNSQCSPQSQRHRLDQALSRLRQRILERPAATSATPHATKEAAVQLPWWHDLDRAIPNHLARSSLFAPVARGRRATHEGKVLISRSDVQLRYWGVQLDEPDSDVWMQALHEARRHPVGAPVPVIRSHFLKSLGRHIGSTDYGWLHESFLRLSLGMLEIKTRKYTVGEVPGDATPSKGIHRVLHLIDGFDLDEELDILCLHVIGVKVKASQGQPNRFVAYAEDDDHPLVAALARRLRMEPGKKLHVQIASAANFTTEIRRLGHALWRDHAHTITATCFRHQWSADVKASGDGDAASRGLGHRSSKTRRNYGTAHQARVGQVLRPVRIEAELPLKTQQSWPSREVHALRPE